MTWRSILIQKPARLSLQQSHLLIKQDQEYLIPLEDIAVIVIEAKEVNLTAPLLSALAQSGITLLTCDETFTPCGQWLSFAQYHRSLKILHAQIHTSEPQKKRLWQKIIRQKITNQAWLAEYSGHDIAAKQLYNLAQTVQSGDKTHHESQAAALYFTILFGSNFHRRRENFINSQLNYGYAIIRAAIARSLTQYGFHPTLGIHHHNELNAFNLADDIIEPFRPLIDLWVFEHRKPSHYPTTLTPTDKQNLIALLHHQIHINNRTYSTLSAIDRCTQSLQAAILQKNPNLLVLPKILPLKVHTYE